MSQYNEAYRKLVIKVLTEGTDQSCRNGNQLIIPHYSFTINNMENDHKLLYRKMFYKGVLGEFLTITDPTPLTNISQFEANGCNYWKDWAKEDGSINVDYHNMLHPQLEDIINQIKENPDSRRHVIELWNHQHVCRPREYNDFEEDLSLPCCWHGLTFSVIENVLHLTWTQRSVDTMVGLPSDVYLAYLFMNLITTKCNLTIGSCMFSLSNVHIYEEHVSKAYTLVKNRTINDSDKPLKFELKA